MPASKKTSDTKPTTKTDELTAMELDTMKWLDYVRPKASVRTRIRSVGNSKGVILGGPIIEASGLNEEADILIQATDGVIYIIQFKTPAINTDLASWDQQFKAAKKAKAKTAVDPFEQIVNDFDIKEW